MGLALSQNGRLQEAIASLEATVQRSPSFTLAAGFLAASYARSGETERAAKLMEEIRLRSARQYVSPACFSIYFAALGQSDHVFASLQAALDERDPYLTRVDAEPYFEPFRPDPRFGELMQRMNLGWTP
jgi:tetratricopeptide (TPR) repeat protein